MFLVKQLCFSVSYKNIVYIFTYKIVKTTLALEIAKEQPSIHLDLDNREDLQKLQDPAYYFGLYADKLVILDEVQRYLGLCVSLRLTTIPHPFLSRCAPISAGLMGN